MTVSPNSLHHSTVPGRQHERNRHSTSPAFGRPMPMPNSLLLIATVYRTLYGVLGAYLAACLAPNRPMKHALILGAIGFAVSVLGTVATWNGGPAFGPHWYPIALDVLAMPQSWLGGKLRESQLSGK